MPSGVDLDDTASDLAALTVIIPIVDPDDDRIEVFRDVRDRDLAGSRQGFIAEGEVVLNVLARNRRHRVHSILISEKRLDRLSSVISQLGDDVTVYSAAQGVMDAIAGFPIHRGILAYGQRRASDSPAGLLAGSEAAAIVLMLYGLANHDNMGGVFRNAAAFGVSAILLDSTCCDPLYRKSIRVSVGAALCVPFARLGAGQDALALLGAHGFKALALSPSGRTRLDALKRLDRTAVLLGAEGPGLPESVLSRAETIAIPMSGAFDSLNVATTSGIVLHHLACAGRGYFPSSGGEGDV